MPNHNQDPYELLRRSDPAPLKDMPGPESAFGQRVKAAAKSGVPVVQQRKRRVPTVAIAAAAALAGVAAAYYLTRPATEPSVVVCYQAATLDATREAVAAPPALTTAACEQPWIDGTLKSDTLGEGEIPPLVGCVNDTGTLWVFPSNYASLCKDLGLANHEPTGTPDDSTTLMGLLSDMINLGECLSIADAQQEITQILDTNDLTLWQINVVTAPTDERPCASFSLDAPTKTINLVPIPTPPQNEN
ncbi:MAG: hypothetical protein QNL26_11875 [Acidimicrobiia bacterium]|nr:hypothetical protein [Acidimicrobiia bacterium]